MSNCFEKNDESVVDKNFTRDISKENCIFNEPSAGGKTFDA